MNKMNRRKFIKTSLLTGASISLSIGMTGCNSSDSEDSSATSLKFAVLSDLHVFDTDSLCADADTDSEDITSALYAYISSDRKMILDSVEILETMVEKLLDESDLDMLIIPGDLTKDGEYVCHEKVINILSNLRTAGIKVYVVPGNHDINNPDAVYFDGESTESVDTISASEFQSLYADYGYDDAIYTDSSSLSYIVEPVDGVWLVAVDSCKYSDDDNAESPETSGEITDETIEWLEPLLEEAQELGKVVFGMLHHGVVSHFDSQSSFFSEYLIDEYETVGKQLAGYGLNLVFTGHFHAQDAVSADYNDDGITMMYDVETGSPVTYPCPYRVIDMDISTATFDITSNTITNIDSIGDDFETYAKTFIDTGMVTLYETLLASYESNLTESISDIAALGAEVHVAHYAGDEVLTAISSDNLTFLYTLLSYESSTYEYLLGSALYALGSDPGLDDNDLSLSISDDGSTTAYNLVKRILDGKRIAVS